MKKSINLNDDISIEKNEDISINEILKSLLDAHMNLMILKSKHGEEEMNHAIKHFTPWKFVLAKVFGMDSSAHMLQKTCMYYETEHDFEEALGDLFWMYEIRSDESWRSNKVEEAYESYKEACYAENKREREVA